MSSTSVPLVERHVGRPGRGVAQGIDIDVETDDGVAASRERGGDPADAAADVEEAGMPFGRQHASDAVDLRIGECSRHGCGKGLEPGCGIHALDRCRHSTRHGRL